MGFNMLNTNELMKLSKIEILNKVATAKAELFNLKFTKFTTGSEKPHLAKELKKDIARLLTALNAKKQ